MARPPSARVDEVGVASARFAHRPAKAIGRLGHHDQVNLIGRQAISLNLDLGFMGLLGEQVPIDFVIAILEANIASRRFSF